MQPENSPSDAQLSAYLDGELDEATSAWIEQLAAGDPELRQRIDELAAVDAKLADAFPIDARDPAVTRLAERMKTQAGATVIALEPRRRTQKPTSPGPLRAAAIAASLALLIGFGAGLLVSSDQGGDQSALVAVGPVVKGTPLAELLERRATGDAVVVDPSAPQSFLVIATTFKDRRGRPCREFEATRALRDVETVASVGVACRSDTGWTVKGVIAVADPDATGTETGITPSSDEVKDALSSLLTALGATPALTPAEEAKSLARGWR